MPPRPRQPDDGQLGRRIQAARIDAGLTLRELAARLDWPISTLHNYEQGRRALRMHEMQAIAHALGCPPVAFLLDDPELTRIVGELLDDPELIAEVRFFLDSLRMPAPEPPF